MSKFNFSTNKKNITKEISLEDVLDNPGRDLQEIKSDKSNSDKFPWDDNKISKKDRFNFLWSMKKIEHLKLDWIAQKMGYSKTRVLEDIVYPALDKKIKKINES